MAKFLTKLQVNEQSNNAYGQWAPRWREWAAENGKIYKRNPRSHKELLLTGKGKTILVCGMGASFEEKIDVVSKYSENVDIACIDKAFGYLVERGITPNYVFVADAMVSYEKYAKKYVEATKNSTLVMNVTGNPEWSKNWRGPVYFYVNKDNIESEKEFASISGCDQIIPASSNVGNTAVVFITQLMGYDQHLLIGYDFCWTQDTNYYAFHDAEDKRAYMRHQTMINNNGDLSFTSNNLFFSSRWLAEFLRQLEMAGIRLVVKNCGMSIFPGQIYNLEKQLKAAQKRPLLPNEKLEFVNAHRQDVTIGPKDFDKLNDIMNQKGKVPVGITISLIDKEVEDHVRER